MNKKIIIAILIVAALVAGAAYLRGLFDEKAAVVIDERNDAIYAALAAAGIENALVDVTDARTIVDYEVPGGMNKEVALFYVLGAAARYAAAESTITATKIFRGFGKRWAARRLFLSVTVNIGLDSSAGRRF